MVSEYYYGRCLLIRLFTVKTTFVRLTRKNMQKRCRFSSPLGLSAAASFLAPTRDRFEGIIGGIIIRTLLVTLALAYWLCWWRIWSLPPRPLDLRFRLQRVPLLAVRMYGCA